MSGPFTDATLIADGERLQKSQGEHPPTIPQENQPSQPPAESGTAGICPTPAASVQNDQKPISELKEEFGLEPHNAELLDRFTEANAEERQVMLFGLVLRQTQLLEDWLASKK